MPPLLRLAAPGALLLASMTACTAPRPAAAPPPGDLAFTAHELYPEGVAYDAAMGDFYVSSMRYGTVGRVAQDGTYSPFADAGPLVSTQGIAVDAARGRLLVAGGDLGVGTRTAEATQERMAGVTVYDLGSGALLAHHDLAALTADPYHHANDLALDADGTAYVTDSFAGVVYRITPAGEASVFARSPLMTSEHVGLNGIAVHPGGFLLVAHAERGTLLRVPLADPSEAAEVALPEALPGADGLVLLDGRRLVVAQNEGHDRTLLLTSDDAWHTAAVATEVPSREPFPTTAARAGDAVFVLNARLEELFDPEAARSSRFLLQRVTF